MKWMYDIARRAKTGSSVTEHWKIVKLHFNEATWQREVKEWGKANGLNVTFEEKCEGGKFTIEWVHFTREF